jgi:hypothetical protein
MSNNIYDILKKFNNLDSVKNILSEGKKVKEGTGKCNESDKGKMCPVHGMKECSGMYEGLDMETAGIKEAGVPDEDLARQIAAIARSLKPRRIFEPIAEYFDDSLEDGLSAWNDMGYNDWTMDLAGTVSERLGVDLFELWKKMKSGDDGLDEGAKPDFLDMDKDGDKKEPMKKAAKEKSKGAVAEAVAQVEKQLNEKYMGFKKTLGESPNEDMLSPGQKKIAKAAPPPDKIDGKDFAALRKGKKTNEGFPTTADAKKRMDDREGKTAHGKKTTTATGTKHERDWDKEETGERGRPVKDKFAKKK